LNSSVKAIHVSFDGKTFVEPSLKTAVNKTYPVVRPLFFYYEKSKEKNYLALVNFILSDEGQAIVQKVGYVPVK
jgi:phosphate transport system substrate-binding protein